MRKLQINDIHIDAERVVDKFCVSHGDLVFTLGLVRFVYAGITSLYLAKPMLSLFAETLQKSKHLFIVITGEANCQRYVEKTSVDKGK